MARPGLGSQTVEYEGTADSPNKFDGTFDGVAGQFECTGDDCSVTADAEGAFTEALVGEWTFIPAYLGKDEMSLEAETEDGMKSREDDLPVPSVAIADTEYEHFGWWTMVAEDGDVAFQTFFGGTATAIFGADTSALEGTATYKGPSAGRYAVKTFNSNSTLDSIRHGEFTAAAELTANFGGLDIAARKHDTISGKVTNFVGQNGDDLSAWNVVLKEIDGLESSTSGDFMGEDNVGGGVGGSPVSSGKWSGQFFGEDTTVPPTSVAGEFDAHSSHGHVAGGFGAVKQ